MRQSRSVLVCVLGFALALLACPAPAGAQFYDEAVRSLDLGTGSPARSPRLLGMGRLSLVGEDRDNRLDLWNFAGNPAGAFGADSVSTFALRPGTDAADGAHDRFDGVRRQDLGSRSLRFGIEGFRRDLESKGAFGVVARFDNLRWDSPADDVTARRQSIGLPSFMPILTGVLPYFGSGAYRYALRAQFAGETVEDRYFLMQTNAAGQFLGLDGDAVDAPDLFEPDEYRVNTSGVGVALSRSIAGAHTLAVGYDAVVQRIKGSNTEERHSTERRDSRPYHVGQASLVGKLGDLAYGADLRGWTSASDVDWRFTTSGGVGGIPLTGRGKLLDREERGSRFDSRVQWAGTSLEFGGRFFTRASETQVTAPGFDDRTSFNAFLQSLRSFSGADTLVLPDSIVDNETNERVMGFGVGLGWKGARARAGVEFHWQRDAFFQDLAGFGPERQAWDVRAGTEYACNPSLTGRLGYQVRSLDEDAEIELTEYRGHGPTVGLGYRPTHRRWMVDVGWGIEWRQSDFGDPSRQRSSRQNLSSAIRWDF